MPEGLSDRPIGVLIACAYFSGDDRRPMRYALCLSAGAEGLGTLARVLCVSLEIYAWGNCVSLLIRGVRVSV